MLDSIKETTKNAFNRLADATVETYDKVYEKIFGVNFNENDPELQSMRSFRSSSNRRQSRLPDNFNEYPQDDYDEIETSRNLVVSSSTLFRKGPIPIEFLSTAEQNRLSRRGCLAEWNDSHYSTSDNDLNFEDPSSKSLLTYFARLGTGEDDKDSVNLAFVDSLLNAGADFNYPDVFGQSIFYAIVRDWHIDVAAFAIDRGADVCHKDKYGRTPLHLAAAVNYAEMVEFLLDNDENVTYISNLNKAIWKWHTPNCDSLQKKGTFQKSSAEINAKTNGEEQTPLHYAAKFNSVNAMKVLIQKGAMIDSLDFMQRTPLQVAAEIGATEVAKFLLKLGVPTGVYDTYGNSAIFLMVEKMPELAFEGLNQFFVEDNAMRRRYYYLDHLEFDVKSKGGPNNARNVLQAIVMYREHKLIMHPVIQKLLDVKWKLYGKRSGLINNFMNIFYTLLATVLTYSIPYSTYDTQFSPVKEKVWKIVLATIFIVLTFYFWIKQILFVKSSTERDKAYKEQRLFCVKRQLQYCHPCWPEEKEYFKEEIQRIQHYKSAFWQDKWNIFEWVSLIVIVLMFILFIVNQIDDNRNVFKAAKLVSALSLLLVWFRLYKTLRVIRLFSELTVYLGHVITETCRFFLLFMDFYIPYIFMFFMLFGGEYTQENEFKNANITTNHLENFNDVLYHVWILTVKSHFPEEQMATVDRHVSQIVVGTFFMIVAVLLFFIYIGRLSEVFCRLHKKANANANLQVAALLINEEKALSQTKQKQQKKYLRHNCGPMVLPYEGNKGADDSQNINIGIDRLTNKVEEITNFLGKASFTKEEKQPINTDHLTLFKTELGKLSQRQTELDNAVEAVKTKITAAQKRTTDSIKETIAERSSKVVRRRPRAPARQNNSGYMTE